MPKVSVVVPVYNAQNFIERCLDSILSQTENDIEVILVDDGSTDESASVCQKYCDKDSRVKLIRQNNSGPDIARKTGTLESRGQYVMFVDADDYVSKDIVEHLLKAAEEYDAAVVCSQIIRFDEQNRQWDGSLCAEQTQIYDNVGDAMKAYFVDEYLKGTYYAKLIDSALMKSYRFVEDAVIGEDISAALYLFAKAARIVVIPDRDYYYFWNHSSISHSGYTDRHRKSLENYIAVREGLLQGKYVDDKIICGYFAEYEMAVATAMSRSWTYVKDTAQLLRNDIKKYWKQIRANKKTAAYMKICMQIYLISPRLFMFMYRIIYLVTGR